MKLALVGVGVGLVGAYAATRLMSSLLFEVSATDPVTFAARERNSDRGGAPCVLPAGARATKVDPGGAQVRVGDL